MKMLALEFSSIMRDVAVHGGPRPGGALDEGGRVMKPFELINAALAEAGMQREEIECIAVGLGPGSYAGIRTAIAIAQGWQLARGVKLLGLPSAEAVAAHAGQLGVYNPVFVGLAAQGGELLVAEYDASVFERPRLVRPFQRRSRDEMGNHDIYRMDLPPGSACGDWETPFFPEADYLALLAAGRTEFVAGSELEPVYLRPVEFVKAPAPKFRAD